MSVCVSFSLSTVHSFSRSMTLFIPSFSSFPSLPPFYPSFSSSFLTRPLCSLFESTCAHSGILPKKQSQRRQKETRRCCSSSHCDTKSLFFLSLGKERSTKYTKNKGFKDVIIDWTFAAFPLLPSVFCAKRRGE